jgi:hypothetical protein
VHVCVLLDVLCFLLIIALELHFVSLSLFLSFSPLSLSLSFSPLSLSLSDEHVCFTITRSDGEEEVWMELVDASTNLKYYHNPALDLTQWELPSEIQSYLNKEYQSSLSTKD